MEAPATQPPVTAFLLGQLRRLSDEARGLERVAAERVDEAATTEAGGSTDTWPEEWLG